MFDEEQEYYPEFNGLSIGELGTKLEQLEAEKDDLEAQLKGIDRQISHLKVHRIPEMLESEGLKNIRLSSGRGITVTNQVYVSVLAADRQRFHDWLRDTGRESLIVPTVHPGTLKSAVKGWLDDSVEYPADLVKVSIIPTAKFFGSKS